MAATARRHTMGAVDAIWLHMDRPENLLVIDTLMWFDGTVRVDRLRAVVTERLLDRFPVFRMRPAEPVLPLGPPRWVDDPRFDLDQHLVVRRLAAPGGDAALREFVEEHISQPLDLAHPLWQVWLVHGYRPDDGGPAGSVVLARIHHAVADGIALAHVLLSLTDPADDAVPPPAPAPADDGARGPLRAALHLFADLARLVRPEAAVDALTLAWQTGQVVDKLLLGSLPRTPLSGTPGIAKRAVWSRPHDLAAVKAAGRATGSTVNDILMSAVGGAVASYLTARGAEPVDLTAMVPVNVRAEGPLPTELGNRFALVLFPLVSTVVDARTRLDRTRGRMDAIKASPEAAITFGTIGAIGLTHPQVERLLVDFFSAKAVGVLTNVVGPADRRTLAGVPLTGVLGWVPQAADQTLGVCVFSYAGTVRVGFRADAAVVTDPELLVVGFDAALAELVALGGGTAPG
jgi:WS/DGAT/MGAT family acyltransferase